jgi:hypothetical protein
MVRADAVFQAVACAGPWELLVVATVAFPRGSLSIEEAAATVVEQCGGTFANTFIGPDESTWLSGDRTVVCAVSRELLASPEPGSCYTGPRQLESVRTLELVSCYDLHNYELVGGVEVKVAERPTGFREDDLAQCHDQAREYLGGSGTAVNTVRLSYFLPSEDSWKLGDRWMRCYLSADGGAMLVRPLQDIFRHSY